MQTECLVTGTGASQVGIRVRFLQLVQRSVGAVANAATHEFRSVPTLVIEGQTFYPWQEAMELETDVGPVDLESLGRGLLQRPFDLPATTSEEILYDSSGMLVGRLLRTQQPIAATITVEAKPAGEHAFKISVSVQNVTPTNDSASMTREQALMRSLVSTHIVLGVTDGDFVSLLDPPESLKSLVSDCRNQGWFPVMVGDEGQHDTLLVSPIILYDYPQIAPESAGDLFDGTEIDEILSLRILTLTDAEKDEMRQSDLRTRQILERTENMPAEQFMKLHGVLRSLRPIQGGSQ
jgi:hydrogenase maturation protease